MDDKLTEEELQERLDEASKVVSIGGIYTHYKEKLYKVQQFAILESTNEVCVIYQALYGGRHKFIRPLSNWMEEVDVNGKKMPRFRLN